MLRISISIPGFKEVAHNLRTAGEEIDIALRNESADPFWSKQPSYLLVECKNWSSKVGTSEVAWFAEKLQRRPSASFGFFYAVEGFSQPVDLEVRTYRERGLQMVLVDRPDLERLVHEPAQRDAILKELHARWSLAV